MTEIRVEAVRELQELVDDASATAAKRSLEVRRFCNHYKPNAPRDPRLADAAELWTKVDTDHLLTISSDMALLSNYLIERVVAAA